MLPVGGIREKVLAAHRAGIRRVALPALNQKDVHELTPKVRAEMTFLWCETIEHLIVEAIVDGAALVAPMLAARSPAAPSATPTSNSGDPTAPHAGPPLTPPPPQQQPVLAQRSRL